MDANYLRSVWVNLRNQFRSLPAEESRMLLNVPKKNGTDLPFVIIVAGVDDSDPIFAYEGQDSAAHAEGDRTKAVSLIRVFARNEDGTLSSIDLTSADAPPIDLLMAQIILTQSDFEARNVTLLFNQFLGIFLRAEERRTLATTPSDWPQPSSMLHIPPQAADLIQSFAELTPHPDLELPSFYGYQSCFISHSSKDATFCQQLYLDLVNRGVNCWYFPLHAKWGEGVWSEITKAIARFDRTLVVCSENSLTSGPVLREIERALRKEDEHNSNVLFPICIDDYVFNEWAHPRKADVLAKTVGDLSSKTGSDYERNVARLAEALKAE